MKKSRFSYISLEASKQALLEAFLWNDHNVFIYSINLMAPPCCIPLLISRAFPLPAVINAATVATGSLLSRHI